MQPKSDSPFATVIGLGALKSEHTPKGVGRWFNLIFGAGCALMGPGSLVLALALGYDAYTRHGLARVDNAIFPPLIVGAIGFGLGALILWEAWNNWGIQANLYEHGFAYYSRKGLQPVRWDQVEAVWQAITKHYRNGVYTGTTYIYTVKTTDNRKLVLDNKLPRIEELGKAVQASVTDVLWPKYIATLQAGQKLTFGPLALDSTSIYSGNKVLRWDEIESIKLQQGNLSVKKKNGGWFNWASASVPQIPNFYIFYNLVSRFAKME